ncbi:unnamed protein product [Spirodela intermedia]|uniref:Uncharacterized protein n=1 Tax=Spirodela intermedia TaxID=51605 RepID=A0A7I8JK57_SPIIN|nr:unnamed protein product [Spirodela intermedia]CAA6670566.1 unnamed protein product [Spirodela intermedia]
MLKATALPASRGTGRREQRWIRAGKKGAEARPLRWNGDGRGGGGEGGADGPQGRGGLWELET